MANDREYYRNRRRARREKFLQLLGGQCINCGSTEDLHFDHIDPASKEYHISELNNASESKLNAEVQKCQLLCGPCHRAKTKAEWSWKFPPTQHGSLSMYLRYKCRCDKCKQTISDYHRNRNANRNKQANEVNDLVKISYIRQLPDGRYRVYSETGKNLGTTKSLKAAKRRLRQIEYFKYLEKKK